MAQNAPMIQYRQEFIQKFEQTKPLLRESVVTESMIKGNQATFILSGSSGKAITRGLNGKISYRGGNLDQITATLKEKHAAVSRSGFNVFQSQGDARKMMYADCSASISQDIDEVIIDALEGATNTISGTQLANLALVTKIQGILGYNKARFDKNLTALITPAFFGEMLKVKEFANSLYVNNKPIDSGKGLWSDEQQVYDCLGFKWIVHPSLPGAQTSAEKCFFYHKNALGHAIDRQGIQFFMGYDEQQDYSWARSSVYHGATILQQSGIVEVTHDGSSYVI